MYISFRWLKLVDNDERRSSLNHSCNWCSFDVGGIPSVWAYGLRLGGRAGFGRKILTKRAGEGRKLVLYGLERENG